MPSVVDRLTKMQLITPPSWLVSNVHYETIMGSIAFGVSTDDSDFDTIGFCIPPKDMVFPHLAGRIQGFGRQQTKFVCYQKHGVFVENDLGGKGRVYDLNVYNIVHYFHLCMENNPNMVASLFTPQECVLHSTKVANMVRDFRRSFLHKGAWHRFKGYAYNQLHKMRTKKPEPGSKRAASIEKCGYDCYEEEMTEFLTDRGWRRFDAVESGDLLATVSVETGRIEFQKPVASVDKLYTGKLYTVKSHMSRCSITGKHQMLVSPAHRNPSTNYSYGYFPDKADWQLIPFCELIKGYRSWFHIRRAVEPREEEYPVSDEYLKLAGLFVSDGTIAFRDGRVKDGRCAQTLKGKLEFYEVANSLGLTRYEYAKETVWRIKRPAAERLYQDFGHGSLNKRLPAWCLKLSHRQVKLFFHSLWLGDGTETPNGDCYYTSNGQLAGDIQAMMVSAGFVCSVRGPYESKGFNEKPATSYQVYVSNETGIRCVNFKNIATNSRCSKKESRPIVSRTVVDCRVVCFEVLNSTLITRNNGCVAIQGNCKFAYHVIRLLDEVEQILEHRDLDIRRNKAQLKAIRRGDVPEEDIYRMAAEKESALERLYETSSLPYGPDEVAIKRLLFECLEEHYGTLEGAVVLEEDATNTLREIAEIIDRNRRLLG